MTNNLDLDSIMVLKISKEEQDNYMITLPQGEERILLNGGIPELLVMENILKNNLEIERKNIKKYMSKEEINLYQESLNRKNYHYCISILKTLEYHINILYNETNKSLKKGR